MTSVEIDLVKLQFCILFTQKITMFWHFLAKNDFNMLRKIDNLFWFKRGFSNFEISLSMGNKSQFEFDSSKKCWLNPKVTFLLFGHDHGTWTIPRSSYLKDKEHLEYNSISSCCKSKKLHLQFLRIWSREAEKITASRALRVKSTLLTFRTPSSILRFFFMITHAI